jgi:hypothetical protein
MGKLYDISYRLITFFVESTNSLTGSLWPGAFLKFAAMKSTLPNVGFRREKGHLDPSVHSTLGFLSDP